MNTFHGRKARFQLICTKRDLQAVHHLQRIARKAGSKEEGG